MLLRNLQVRESRLFSYTIASADLWYSAINERTLYLRNDPEIGPVLRGEICDLDPDCHADLSQVLLEYGLSCQGCQDRDRAGELVECTGERLGRILATRLFQDAPGLPVVEQVCGAFEFILQSMGFPAQMEQAPGSVRYDLACCPLLETAQETGLSLGLVTARRGFVALCTSMLKALAPGWTMVKPAAGQVDGPFAEIVLHY